jgi:pimeloyl-ACP methyl ester carboxylesterase
MVFVRRWVLQAVLAWTALLPGTGCLSFVHPVATPAPELAESCKGSLQCARDHVYVFFIHGLDPFDLANLEGVRTFVHELGFRKTYFGQLHHKSFFEREIHRLHEEDGDARFVLIGFSYGANAARSIAQTASHEDIAIDLIVYLGGNTLTNTSEDQPDNAREIINILASGCIWNGSQMDRARNYNVSDVYHFGSPSHPLTLEVLARELTVVTASVPVSESRAAMPHADESLPTPRPVKEPPSAKRDEWDFLKPIDRLPPPKD